MTARFPWNVVRGFKVESCADCTFRVTPDLVVPKDEDGFGGPGVLTRMALANWIEARLAKKKPRGRSKR